MSTEHRYRTDLVWDGSTAGGYRAYSRTHRVSAPPASAELELSSDPSFGGDSGLVNPEQLLLAAASSCQLLSFLAEAARARIEVVHYEDDAEAVMPVTREPMRITRIILRPQIVVAGGTDLARVRDLVEVAHHGCFIANTLNAEVVLEPHIEFAAPVLSQDL